MEHIALEKSTQSSFSKAVKNIKSFLKKNPLIGNQEKRLGKTRKDEKKTGLKKYNLKTGEKNDLKKSSSEPGKNHDLKKFNSELGKKDGLKPEKKHGTHGRGVVYLSHVPKGFYEEQISKYFNQFGKVTRMSVARSKKTGKPKGFAFIEFMYSEVAKVVADTMNNHLMCGRLLKAEYIPGESVGVEMFKKPSRFSTDPKIAARKMWIKKMNMVIDPIKESEMLTQHTNRLNRVKKRLQKYGIKLDCQVVDVPEEVKVKKEKVPVLVFDESDEEVDFKMHPNITKVSKSKLTALEASSNTKKRKINLPARKNNSESTNTKKQKINLPARKNISEMKARLPNTEVSNINISDNEMCHCDDIFCQCDDAFSQCDDAFSQSESDEIFCQCE